MIIDRVEFTPAQLKRTAAAAHRIRCPTPPEGVRPACRVSDIGSPDSGQPAIIGLNPLFSQPIEQLARLRQVARDQGWELTHQDFFWAARQQPTADCDGLLAPVLVPYLGSFRGTAERLIVAIERHFGPVHQTMRFSQAFAGEIVKPSQGVSRPMLRWETIDFGHDAYDQPLEMAEAAHLGVLAAVLAHPDWARQIGQPGTPKVAMGGCLMAESGHGPIVHPTLGWNREHGLLYLGATDYEAPGYDLAFPRLVYPG